MGIDGAHAGDIDQDRVRVSILHALQQRLHHLLRAVGVQGTDQRHDDHAVGHRNDGRAQLTQRGFLRRNHLLFEGDALGFAAQLIADVVRNPGKGGAARVTALGGDREYRELGWHDGVVSGLEVEGALEEAFGCQVRGQLLPTLVAFDRQPFCDQRGRELGALQHR